MEHMKIIGKRKFSLIFYQNRTNNKVFTPYDVNNSLDNERFSLLDQIDLLRPKQTNRYVFLLEYPGYSGRNIMSQRISPHVLRYPSTDEHFRCIECTWKSAFGPLRIAPPKYAEKCYIAFDTNEDYWYGIGTYSYKENVLPGPIINNDGVWVPEVKLWLQIGNVGSVDCRGSKTRRVLFEFLITILLCY